MMIMKLSSAFSPTHTKCLFVYDDEGLVVAVLEDEYERSVCEVSERKFSIQ